MRAPTPLLVLLFVAGLLAPAAGGMGQDIRIDLERFGVGSFFRAGDWTAARFRVTLDRGEATPAILVWEVENGDGDITEHLRPIVLSPGQPTVRWLSARLAPQSDASSVYTVRIYADDDGARGPELASARVSAASAQPPASQVPIDAAMIALVGERRMNLDGYSWMFGTMTLPPAQHELTRIVAGLDSRELPDRWEGLSGFEAIVWADIAPQTLELEESEALREYVRRGGHLVVVLPNAGNPWGLGTAPSHQLHDLLPTRGSRRVEGVPVSALVQILSRSDELRNPDARTNVVVFDPAALDNGWEPLLALPLDRELAAADEAPPEQPPLAGEVVAAQRRLGFGRLTLIGIDVASLWQLGLQPSGLPQPDAFWNQVLGRRGDTPHPAELEALSRPESRRLSTRGVTEITMGRGALVSDLIGMSGDVTLGTLLAVIVFASYWAIAGPVGFVVLRRTGRVRHAWVAFALTGALFTAVAWSIGAVVRQGNVRIQHVTVLDHIAPMPGAAPDTEPRFQRATSWFSAYLPGYGATEVAIRSEPGQRDLLSSWIPPPGSAQQRFPNVDRYEAPYATPNRLDLPSRATASTLEARWLGVVDPDLGRLPYASSQLDPVREEFGPGKGSLVLRGRLRHDLRGALRDVKILHVSSFRTPLRRSLGPDGDFALVPGQPGDLPAFGRMGSLAVWEPGTELDLANLYTRSGREVPLLTTESRTMPDGLAATLRAIYVDPVLRSMGITPVEPGLDSALRRRYLEAMGLFGMLPQPAWFTLAAGGESEASLRFKRWMGRELDLSAWFTRPCLIVTGFLEDELAAPMPIPIEIDGDAPPSTGITLVRWILPLPLQVDLLAPSPRAPFEAPPATEQTPPSEEEPTGRPPRQAPRTRTPGG